MFGEISSEAKPIVTRLSIAHSFLIYTEWGKGRLTVVWMENNTTINTSQYKSNCFVYSQL